MEGGFFHEKFPSVNDLDLPGYLWEICHLHNDQWQSCWYRPGFDRSDENSRVFSSDSSSFLYQLFFVVYYVSIYPYCFITTAISMCVSSCLYIFGFIFISMHLYSYLLIQTSNCQGISSNLWPSPSIPSILQYERPSIAVSHQSDYDYPLTPIHRIHRSVPVVHTF